MKYLRQFTRLREDAGDGAEGGGDGGGGNATPSPLSGFYGEDGLNREAVSALPESASGLKGLLEKYPNEEAFYGGIKNLQFLAGQKSLQRLDPNATDAEKAQHATMVKEYFGTPDHVEGYGIKKPDEIPDEVWNADSTNKQLEILHKHNASPELVRELAEFRINEFKDEMAKVPEQQAARVAEINAELQKEFGNDLPAVSQNAMKGLAALGIDLPESGNIADLKISFPQIVAAGQRMTELISEDVIALEARRDASGNTAGSYLDQANDIKTNPNNPFYADENSPIEKQKASQREFLRLMNLHETMRGGK